MAHALQAVLLPHTHVCRPRSLVCDHPWTQVCEHTRVNTRVQQARREPLQGTRVLCARVQLRISL